MNISNLKVSSSDKLVQFVISNNFKLFKDQFGQGCLVTPDAPLVAKRICSKETRVLLRKIVWEQTHKTLQEHSVDNAVNTLEGIALFNESTEYTYTRVAKVENRIYYDLGDDKHVIEITPEGWSLKTQCPVYFRRYAHQIPQVSPVQGGSLENLKRFVHIESRTHEILLLSYLPVCLVADIDRPLLLMHGPQGAGKSTALEFIRGLIDPSRIPLLQPPKDITEMVQQANKNYAYFLDNLSYIKQDVSDTFCRFVTGSAFSKRMLYTDDDDFLYEFKRVTGFTSIAQIANNSDLLDRSLIIQLELLNQTNRIPDEQLNKEFAEQKPLLLGALFDATSGMLRALNTTQIDNLPRMADYYRYAIAASIHLGFGDTEFRNAYSVNIKHQNQETIESSPIIQCVLIFLKGKTEYTGTSTALYLLLKNIAVNFDMIHGFPKGATWLWRKIQQYKATFAAIGITAERNRDTDARYITINKTEAYNQAIEESIPDINEGNQVVFLESLNQLPT